MGVVIRRGKLPSDNFTMVPNAYARNALLSWGARGLLVWLMSHAAEYEITEDGIISAGPSKRDGVRKMVGELEEHGYLRRDRSFTPGIGTTVAYVLTTPDDGKSGVTYDGKSVVSADQGERDVSAGQPDDGKSGAPSYIEDQEKTNTKTSSSLRATRLPDGFMPTEQMRAWFAAENLSAVLDGRIEHEKFCDYWRAEAGARAKKLDWAACWRRWMRTAAERSPRRPGNSLMPISGAPYRPSTTDQKVAQTLELGRRLQQQMEESA